MNISEFKNSLIKFSEDIDNFNRMMHGDLFKDRRKCIVFSEVLSALESIVDVLNTLLI